MSARYQVKPLGNKQGFVVAAVIATALFCWALVSTAEVQDAEQANRVHCEMVALWKSDAAQDVPPEQRRGWPNYDGRPCK